MTPQTRVVPIVDEVREPGHQVVSLGLRPQSDAQVRHAARTRSFCCLGGLRRLDQSFLGHHRLHQLGVDAPREILGGYDRSSFVVFVRPGGTRRVAAPPCRSSGDVSIDVCCPTSRPEGQPGSSCLGSLNQSNTSLSNVMISAIRPSSMRSTSGEKASYVEAPGRLRYIATAALGQAGLRAGARSS